MKRVEKDEIVGEGKKRRKENEAEEIPMDNMFHLGEAIVCAVKPNSTHPIILQVRTTEGYAEDDYDLAYWPSTIEIGFLFMKTLIKLRKNDRKKHCSLVFLLDSDEDEEFQFPQKPMNISELGIFKKVLYWDRKEEDTELECCDRSSLSTFLYHEQCYQ